MGLTQRRGWQRTSSIHKTMYRMGRPRDHNSRQSSAEWDIPLVDTDV